jgi:hypothetical protein
MPQPSADVEGIVEHPIDRRRHPNLLARISDRLLQARRRLGRLAQAHFTEALPML